MQTFLDQVAEKVLEQTEHSMESICLVTPNRRAGLFLKKSFSVKINRPIWAPDVLSMEDFIQRITGITLQEPVALLLDFYRVYCREEQEKAEPLEEFLKWAPMLIRDFNDIDAHMPEPKSLFESVTDAKRIEAWNPDGKPLSEFQKKYLHFFEKFRKWHAALAEELTAGKIAYQGLAYRHAATALSAEDIPAMPWDYIYFIGFSALNQAEETIIRSLTRKKKAEVIWDADKYYVNNPNHEAGMFLRKYRKEWILDKLSFMGDHFSMVKKNIQIYGVAKNVNQAKLAANILQGFPKESIPSHQTAIVLANEDLLLPVLNSIPEDMGKVNITMGFPIRKTSIYALFESLFQLHVTTLRMKSAAPGLKSAFYFKDVVRFFRHPAISVLVAREGKTISTEAFVREIYASKKTFISVERLASFWGDAEEFKTLFSPFLEGFAKEPQKMIPALLQLKTNLDEAFRRKSEQEEIPVEDAPWFTDFETLYPISVVLRKLEAFASQQTEVNDLRTLFMLFQAMTRESKLVLSGEPLAGLQIMGMLETRNLDFKNLIILSANEDILPAAKSNNSLIPFDVKAYYNIPVYKEKDAIFAYHFYRLLQRAENVHIIYNTQSQDMGSSEKSRFITQLQMEMPQWNPQIMIQERIIPLPSAATEAGQDIRIPKSGDIMEALHANNKKGFSPTTLNHYIRCSLFFYFRHIAGIKETVTPEETIQANTLGTVVHEVLQTLYNDEQLIGKELQPHHMDTMIPRITEVTAIKFEQFYKGGDISSGKNLLLARVAARFVKNFLLAEKKLLEEWQAKGKTLKYLRAEMEDVADVPMTVSDTVSSVRFKGTTDRVDQLGNTIRVIDYKTGRVEKEELKIRDWDDITTDPALGKSFQLLMYAMLYNRKYGMPAELMPGIVSFRNLGAGLLTLSYPEGYGTVDPATLQQFESKLQDLMQEIFDPETPFRRTEDEQNCIHCDFRITCNR